MKISLKSFSIFTLLVFCAAAAMAQAPHTMPYQGRLADNAGNAITGEVLDVVFTIYDDTTAGATDLWTETDTLNCDDNGVFTIELGLENPIPHEIFNGDKRWLGIKVGSDNEMAPRQLLSSVPYAMSAPGAGVAYKELAPANSFINLEGASAHSIDSIKITIPGPGYVYVSATASFQINHSSGTNWYYQITNVDDDISYSQYGTGIIQLPGTMGTGVYWWPVSADKIFVEDSPGVKTYYFVVSPSTGYDTGDDIFDLNISAIYFPNNFGPVSAKKAGKASSEQNVIPGGLNAE